MNVFGQFPKRCHCGRSFSAWEWVHLPGLKTWPEDMAPHPGVVLEQRDCPCGSSLTVEVPAENKGSRGP